MSVPLELQLSSLTVRLALWWAQHPEEELTVNLICAKIESDKSIVNATLRIALETGWLQRRKMPSLVPTPQHPEEFVYMLTPEALPLFQNPLAPHKDLQL